MQAGGNLRILPCLDSEEMAASRKRELGIPRDLAIELGESAVEAARAGVYVRAEGRTVVWRDAVKAASNAKVSIPPDASLPINKTLIFSETTIQVGNETSFRAARRLVEGGERPLCLNLANGIHPGGGFLSGARAQEETLCRSSALYQTLLGDPMYEEHRKRPQPDSTDWAIYSPDVPVFRTDDGKNLEEPWLLSFLTSAAPYAPSVGQPESGDLLQKRIRRVLGIARSYGYTSLVLGAWGCGAFKNDPRRTARDFRSALKNEYSGAFEHIVFAIADWSPERKFLGPFRDVFDRNESA